MLDDKQTQFTRTGKERQTLRPFEQGHSVFRLYADQGQSSPGLSCEAPIGGGDILLASEAHEANGYIAQSGHDLRDGTTAYLRTSFVEGDIPDPMRFILDGSVLAHEAQQSGGIRLGGYKTAHAVDNCMPLLAGLLDRYSALHTKDLLQAEPPRIAGQGCAGNEFAALNPAMAGIYRL
jgi:hypothetical protein